MEYPLRGRPVYDQYLQQNYPENSQPKPPVSAKMPVEGRTFFRSGIEYVEHLEQYKGGKRQSRGMLTFTGFQAVIQHPQGADSHGQAIAEKITETP